MKSNEKYLEVGIIGTCDLRVCDNMCNLTTSHLASVGDSKNKLLVTDHSTRATWTCYSSTHAGIILLHRGESTELFSVPVVGCEKTNTLNDK